VDGHEYCELLGRLAREGGASVETGVALLGADTDGGGYRLATGSGELRCDVVVNAAGAWAGRVGDLLEAPVPILPQRHQAAVAHLPREFGYLMPSVMDYTPRSGRFGLYFRHEGPAKLVAGLHTEEALHDVVDPDDYRRGADPEFLELLAAKLADRLPTLAETQLAHGWAGLYPMSPGGRPQVGPHPDNQNVIVAGGAGGSGLQTSPILGRLAAEWALHGEPRSLPAAGVLRPAASRETTAEHA
jgi:sarcosine oxidase subunit beta